MIFDFTHDIRQPNNVFDILESNTVIASAQVPEFLKGELQYEGEQYSLQHEAEDFVRADICKGQAMFAAVDTDICYTKKFPLSLLPGNSYCFTWMEIGDTKYNIYEVRFDAGRHFYCVYIGDEQVALIHRMDWNANYTCYAVSRSHALALMLYCLYLACGECYNARERQDKDNVGEMTTQRPDAWETKQKALITKYKPDFIEKIRD